MIKIREFILQDFTRVYPLATLIWSLVWGYWYLFFAQIIGEQINHILKYYIVKPMLGDKTYPIIGSGARPKGAVDCGLMRSGTKKKCTSYGMPSGHSQSSLFFSTYMILTLMKNNSKNVFSYAAYIF